MKHATSRELYGYWNRIRDRDTAPRRSAIEPSDIRRILADTFILEVLDRGGYVLRLAGTRMCAIYGREIKSANFLDFWSDDDREAIATLAAAVSSDAAGAVITANLLTGRGHSVACEILLLPLRHSGPAFDRVLGSCAALERPYWLGSEPIVRQEIASLRLIWPDEQPHFMRRTGDRPPEDRPTGAIPIPFPIDNPRRRGHLVVLDGGKD